MRPAVDHTFNSLAEVYRNKVATFLLTGMGHDGAEGCYNLKSAGSGVVLQDKASSVVWGMPAAATEIGAYDRIESLDTCCLLLQRILKNAAQLKKSA